VDCVHHGYEILPEFYGHLEVIHNMSRFGLKIVDGRLTFEVQKIIFSCCRTIWTNHNFKYCRASNGVTERLCEAAFSEIERLIDHQTYIHGIKRRKSM
jgi:hypothetical protein